MVHTATRDTMYDDYNGTTKDNKWYKAYDGIKAMENHIHKMSESW